MKVRTGLLATLLFATACTAGTDGASLPPSSDPTAPTRGGSPTVAPGESGWLAINLRFDPDAFFLTEGSVSFVKVFDVAGELASGNRSKDWHPFFRIQLAPGQYKVKTYRRPCDGSCKSLDPPRNVCEFSADLTIGGNRLVVVHVEEDGDCKVSDKGDVIDFDTARARVTDLDSLKQALLYAGYQVRERYGEGWLGGIFSVRPRILGIGGQELQAFEYRSRSQLMRISISPDGSSISSREGTGAVIEWGASPHYYRSGRLLVLYLGESAVIVEGLSLLMGPQFAGR